MFETANLMHKVVRATYSNNSSGCAADTVLGYAKRGMIRRLPSIAEAGVVVAHIMLADGTRYFPLTPDKPSLNRLTSSYADYIHKSNMCSLRLASGSADKLG